MGIPKITVVCGHCRHHESEPALEINFRDSKIYYICQKCKKESIMNLAVESKPFPKPRVGARG
jgi:hypothetical protein